MIFNAWVRLHRADNIDYHRVEIKANSREEAYEKLNKHMESFSDYIKWDLVKFEYVYSI